MTDKVASGNSQQQKFENGRSVLISALNELKNFLLIDYFSYFIYSP